MGLAPEPMKAGEDKKRGCRLNAKRIRDTGGKLMASRKHPSIAEAFKLINKVNP